MPLRLGTRVSVLARWQAQWVAARLQQDGIAVELVPIGTTGDARSDAIREIGGEGVFTKEIQRALLDGRIDLAVHSLKDLPTASTPGLRLAAVPERGPVNDVLVTAKEGRPLQELPAGVRVGTGSLRRRAQLLHLRPDLRMQDIRGNVETRLRKLFDGEFDAIVLAEAGLRRLGLDRHVGQVLPLQIVLPAVGQGALGIETRDDDVTRELLNRLNHWPTLAAVLAERAMLAALRGGCMAPVAAFGNFEHDRLTLAGRVLSHDGAARLDAAGDVAMRFAAEQGAEEVKSTACELGDRVAAMLLEQGAAALIDAARHASKRLTWAQDDLRS